MNRLAARSQHTLVLSFLLICFAAVTLLLSYTINPQTAGASPMAPATPTCPPSGCVHERVYGYQPSRYDMRSTFNDAASNALGNNGPSYDQINRGLPPI
ncbi:MAG: hypothetical protein Q9O62_07410 [Ardenticatenia bacterium]|nr:hypothetical protein [Ardenticatenia bacterium]